jgi:GxxExxY protein
MQTHNIVTGNILDASFQIHSRLGPGLFESVYEPILFHELVKRGLKVDRQRAIPIYYDGMVFDEGFRADLVINDSVLVELKSVEKISRVHKKQVLTYLRLANYRVGLLINFGEDLIKNGIHRIVNSL